DVDFVRTERPKHATLLAETAAKEGRELVVATGGDGSIHEVAVGLMQAKEAGATATKLGIIGRGTGGDFVKTLGIEHRLERYLEVIATGISRPVDVGRFTYVDNAGKEARGFFVNILSAGMGGLVDRYVHETAKWAGGRAGYFIASARALLASEPGQIEMTLTENGQERRVETSTRMLAVCNGRYFGSGMFVAPPAELDDGLFEVVDLGASSKLGFAVRSSAIYKGDHMKQPEVRHHRCSKVRFHVKNERAKATFLLDVDGEPLGSPPVEIEVVPRALEVLRPLPSTPR
ncbi:MAG TPA: diacylglycerol kinase family protein, partial [Polyangiaceae bacterium]|nr:diacylglycerol kinase family protein [Polyangiaceae bacterium]